MDWASLESVVAPEVLRSRMFRSAEHQANFTVILCSSNWCVRSSRDTSVELDGDLSEDDIQKMLTHIKQLHSIR